MKKVISICLVVIIFFYSLFDCHAQDLKPKLGTPERAAEGQSKWMMSRLKFDSILYYSVYKVNLKHQLISDSIHAMVNLSSTEKMKLYETNNKDKEMEFKRLFSATVFQQYRSLLQDIKNKQPSK